MKSLKIYLWVVTTLLVIALGSGVYVWFVFQNFKKEVQQPMSTELPVVPVDDAPVQDSSPVIPPVKTDIQPEVTATITIPVATLTDTQRSLLSTFGIDDESFTVTPAMIQCAEDAVGKARFTALVDGATPTTRETLILLPCIR